MKWLKQILLLLTMPVFFLVFTTLGVWLSDYHSRYAQRIPFAVNENHKWAEDFMVLAHPVLDGNSYNSPAAIFLRDLPEFEKLSPNLKHALVFDDNWKSDEILKTTKILYAKAPEKESLEKAGYHFVSYYVTQNKDGSQDIEIKAIWRHDRNLYSWYRVEGNKVVPQYVYWEYPGIVAIGVAPLVALVTLVVYFFLFRRLNRKLALAAPVRQDGAN